MYQQINNLRYLKERRRELRKNATEAEQVLWQYLRRYQQGRKFRRQHSVGNYILDFYCPSERLCVELDGAIHNEASAQKYDKERTQFLNSMSIQVIRFRNQEIFENIGGVLREIENKFQPSPEIKGES